MVLRLDTALGIFNIAGKIATTTSLRLGGSAGVRQISASSFVVFDSEQDCILKLHQKQYRTLYHARLFDNMSSSTSKNEFILKLNDRKQVTAKEYKGYVYFHIYDALKHKSVSLTSDELERLYKKMPKLMKVAKELLKTTKDKKNQKPEGKTDKRKKKVKESADMISSSDTADEEEDSQMEESE